MAQAASEKSDSKKVGSKKSSMAQAGAEVVAPPAKFKLKA